MANQARPRADKVSQKVEGAARNVAQNARPMADKASEQLNAGAKSAAGKAALSCQRAPEKQQACAPVAEQRNEALRLAKLACGVRLFSAALQMLTSSHAAKTPCLLDSKLKSHLLLQTMW